MTEPRTDPTDRTPDPRGGTGATWATPASAIPVTDDAAPGVRVCLRCRHHRPAELFDVDGDTGEETCGVCRGVVEEGSISLGHVEQDGTPARLDDALRGHDGGIEATRGNADGEDHGAVDRLAETEA